jgi:hypothetical protein
MCRSSTTAIGDILMTEPKIGSRRRQASSQNGVKIA